MNYANLLWIAKRKFNIERPQKNLKISHMITAGKRYESSSRESKVAVVKENGRVKGVLTNFLKSR